MRNWNLLRITKVVVTVTMFAATGLRAQNLTVAGDLTVDQGQFFGQTTRQMVNLWGTEYGIGVQSSGFYQRTGSDFYWYIGGVHENYPGSPGANGRQLMHLNSDGDLTITGGQGLIASAMTVGSGSNPLCTASHPCPIGTAAEAVALRVKSSGTTFGAPAEFASDVSITGKGNLIISGEGGLRAPTLTVGAIFPVPCRVSVPNCVPGGGVELDALKVTSAGTTFFVPAEFTGNVSITGAGKLFTPYLQSTERIVTPVLEITGGSDLAEPFQTSEKYIPAGSVVIIDDENPGRVKMSEHAYDNRVAGVVSGANGINPGISLRQRGVLEDGQDIALTGRVYVRADASYSPIKPGDLLTTSETPGYAMRARDRDKMQGAIFGKAMSALGGGKGLVLVLVSLQ